MIQSIAQGFIITLLVTILGATIYYVIIWALGRKPLTPGEIVARVAQRRRRRYRVERYTK